MAGDTKVKLSTIFGVIGAVGALLGIGGYLFSFGERIGRIETRLTIIETAQTKVVADVSMNKDDMVSRIGSTKGDLYGRLREHESIMQKMSESIVALTTEVRIRDRDSSVFSPKMPAKAQESRAVSTVDSKLSQMKASF